MDAIVSPPIDLAIMMEKPESDLLKRPPRNKKDHLVDKTLLLQAYLFKAYKSNNNIITLFIYNTNLL